MIKEKFENIQLPSQKDSKQIDIVEFSVGDQYYGTNITHIREIIRGVKDIVPIVDVHPSISGVINLRGRIIPVINLLKHFDVKDVKWDVRARIIIMESQRRRIGFLVSSVTRIHRVLLANVELSESLIQSKGDCIVGLIKIDTRILSLLDLERVFFDIHPLKEKSVDINREAQAVAKRSTCTILIAEDSVFMRNLLVKSVKESGYKVIGVNNGFEAWKILDGTTKLPDFVDIAQYYHLLITDIEMTQMDGLHLVKNIRSHNALKKLPCIVFSSLITEEVAQRCETVGVDGYISKPEISELIKLIDSKVLEKV